MISLFSQYSYQLIIEHKRYSKSRYDIYIVHVMACKLRQVDKLIIVVIKLLISIEKYKPLYNICLDSVVYTSSFFVYLFINHKLVLLKFKLGNFEA